MDNYKLALILKKAGYPQDVKKGNLIASPAKNTDVAYLPTAKELGIACGHDFTVKFSKEGVIVKDNKDPKEYKTKTMLEGLINLWIVQNKKK